MFDSIFRCGPRGLAGSPIFEIGRPSTGATPPPAPEWWQPIVNTLNASGGTGYLWLHGEGIETAVGDPVAEWHDVTDAVEWVQPGASSIRPTRGAAAISFDGIDDRLNDGSSLVSLLTGSTWSVGCGYTSITPATSVWWAATDGSTTNLYNPTTSNARLSVFGGGGSDNLFGVNTPTAPGSVWYARDGSNWARRLSGTETTAINSRTPSGLNSLTLGARRSPSAGVFLTGAVSWFALTNRSLTSTERADIATLLAANGYAI